MSTYREIVFMIQDELKMVSDDSFYTWEHIKFLVNKFRSHILKKTYESLGSEMPESNYQTLCLDVERFDPDPEDPCADSLLLRSTEPIPDSIMPESLIIMPKVSFNYMMSYVSYKRFEQVGHNRYLQNFIYATTADNGYVYLKSQNPQFVYMDGIRIKGVFEDPEQASMLECENSELCDVLDMNFPLEEALVPTLIQSVVKELAGVAYRPKDSVNNASDDLSALDAFIRRNMKDDTQ